MSFSTKPVLFLCVMGWVLMFLPVVLTLRDPTNAHRSTLGTGWECDRGHRQSGNQCIAVQIPLNAHLDFLGHAWECDRGFRQTGVTCVAVQVPRNGHIDFLGHGWECDRGFRQSGPECMAVGIPPNARLDFLGNAWECNSGFKPQSGACVAMTAQEVSQAQQQLDAVRKKIFGTRACTRDGRLVIVRGCSRCGQACSAGCG